MPIAGTAALIPRPLHGLLDKAGNILFSDASYRIRKITPDGFVTSIVGNGRYGYSGDGGPALFAEIGTPFGMAFDAAGNLVFADCYNNVVRRVDAATGTIRTVAGTGAKGFSGDGGPATLASLHCPSGVSFDSSGNLYVVDAANNRLRVVDSNGAITTMAGNGFQAITADGATAGPSAPLGAPFDVQVDRRGNIYVCERLGRIRKIDGASRVLTTVAGGGSSLLDGIPATQSFIGDPRQIHLDDSGSIYFADYGQSLIRRVDQLGNIATVAGTSNVFDGNTALSVVLASPIRLAIDRLGNLLIADQAHHRLRKVDAATKMVTTIAGTGQPGYGGDGVLATGALLQFPAGLLLNAAGDILFSDTANHRVRKADANTGLVATVAGNGSPGSTGDGGPATQASLQSPDGLALDTAGNLYIADAGNGLVRKIEAGTGVIRTLAGNRTYGYSGDGGPATAASLFDPCDVAFDKAGNLLIADTLAQVVRKVDIRAGVITTVAGTGIQGYSGDNGPATLARLDSPTALAISPTGDIYIADSGNNVVRRVAADTGVITTFAGSARRVGLSGDGGLAILAALNLPSGLVFDAAGNLLISDAGYNRVRMVTPAPVVPVLGVAPSTVIFTAQQGGTVPDPQYFYVLNANFVGLSWSAQVVGGDWLTVTPPSGIAPSRLTVSANPSGLLPGDYRATVVVSSPGATGSPQTVSALLAVGAAGQPAVALSTQLLSFQAVSGGVNPAPQTLVITNVGSGSLEWSANSSTATGGNWLLLSAASGIAPSSLFVSLNTRGLSAGVYQGTVSVQPASGPPAVATVILTVTAPASSILLSHTGLQFTAVEGGAALPPQRISVLNAGQGSMSWTAQASTTSGGGWLQVSPQTGTSDSGNLANSPALTVNANASGLKAGTYYGMIVVSAPGAVNAPQLVSVVLRVLAAGTAPPPTMESTGLLYVLAANSGTPAVQPLSLFNPGQVLSFSAAATLASGSGWLSVTPSSGTLQGQGALAVQVNARGLPAGVYRATVTLSFSNKQVLDAAVLVVITSGTVTAVLRGMDADICVAKEQFMLATKLSTNFTLTAGWPVPVLAQVVSNCGTAVLDSAVTVAFDNGDPPLVLANLRTGLYSGTWTPQKPGNRVTLTFRAIHPTLQAASLQLRGSLEAAGIPQVAPRGAVNAASYKKFAPLAPGSIVSVFGSNLADGENRSPSAPLLKTLGGLSLKLGSLDVPLFYASPGQVNAQIPFEVAENTTLQLRAFSKDVIASPESVTIGAVQPGIFTVDQSGAGQGAVLNTRGVLVDAAAPASVGDVLQVFCTGLGITNPRAASGERTPVAPLHIAVHAVTARIGGLDAAVEFAGLAPGFVGLYQVNVRVPAGVTAGNSMPLVLSQEGVESNTVTIAIK